MIHPSGLVLVIVLFAAAQTSSQQAPARLPQPAPVTPAAAELPSIELAPELARVLTDYEAAWSRKDPAALALLFTEDGFVLVNGAPAARGRAAIEKAYTGHGGPLSLRAFASATSGDLGYILGGYTATKGEPDIGKYTLTLRRVGGKWLIVSDMDNSNRRPR